MSGGLVVMDYGSIVRLRGRALLPNAPLDRIYLQTGAQIWIQPLPAIQMTARKRKNFLGNFATVHDSKLKILIVRSRRDRVPAIPALVLP